MTQLNDIITALKRRRAYSHPTAGAIKVVQTQMSVVFLTGDFAYKVKKPVNLGYLDYSTLQQRRTFCNKELELNQRLCPDAYIEVVPITITAGIVGIGDSGEIIDYAVKMRQLPSDRMMDRLLLRGEVTGEMVRAVAARLAGFHARADTGPYINSFGELCSIQVNTDENFSQTETYIGRSLDEHRYQKIKAFSDAFLRSHAALMHERIDRGRIRDCHGDLHAAHICFAPAGICIYDCIEFNDRFRYADVASEVAFLAMDLDRYGKQDLSREFVDAYVEASGDPTLNAVLPFYKCYRAYVRGKVESFKLDDAYLSDSDKAKALKSSRRYFELAYSYAAKPPVLIIMVGLVGTGKTTVAQTLAQTLGAKVISSDVVRKTLAGIPLTEHRYAEVDTGIYSAEFSRRTFAAFFDNARHLLSKGESVVLDATFQRRSDRARAKAIADELSARFLAVECMLPEDEVKRRLEQRMKEPAVSDARWDIYVQQKTTFEPVTELADSEHIVVDTSVVWNDALAQIVQRTDP